jgi:D-3-phosphoglycerate dehydrogenase
MHTVVTCWPIHPNGLALLEAREDVTIRHVPQPTPAAFQDAVGGATAVVIGMERIDEALLARADKLSIVSRFGVGYDLVDVAACTRRGIAVGVTNGANDLAVAEHTLMLLLAVARRAVENDAGVRAGQWNMRGEGRKMGELAGRTILVVGYGRIGTRVARLCAAFGMRVMINDPAFPTPRIAADGYVPAPDLAAALPEIDVLTLHCPASELTRRMINAEMLSLMKPTAWLINAARGALVDEDALIAALQSGRLEAAGLDVLVQEPPNPSNPLFAMQNVVLSPHNAAAPVECFEKMSIRAARNILDRIDGTLDPGFVVNPEALPNRRNA